LTDAAANVLVLEPAVGLGQGGAEVVREQPEVVDRGVDLRGPQVAPAVGDVLGQSERGIGRGAGVSGRVVGFGTGGAVGGLVRCRSGRCLACRLPGRPRVKWRFLRL
jgi:hypothetical protein